MKAKMEGKNIKVQFASYSRNIFNVEEIELEGNQMAIKTFEGQTFFINFANVNLIEEF